MALMFGHTSLIDMQVENSYGTIASGNWLRVPVADFNPGVSQPWERQDIIGLAGGRDEPTPLRGLLTVEPRVEVPVDLNNFGYWLRACMGPATSSGSSDFTHTFVSGGAAVPGISMQHHNASLSANPFMRLIGCRANTLEMTFRMGEAAQMATLGFIGVSASRAGTTASGSPTTAAFVPFTGAVGTAKRAGSALARVTGATLRFSNGLEALREANREGNAITVAAPGVTEITGTVDLRMDSDQLLQDSEGAAGVALSFGYAISATQSLEFTVHAAHLDRIMPPVRGRAGIQATFAYRGTYDGTATTAMTAVLKNQVAAYA
jgi:hypothetical protein